jgi:hypothetical protein
MAGILQADKRPGDSVRRWKPGAENESLRRQKEEKLAPFFFDLVFVGDSLLEVRNDVVGKILGCHRMGVDVPLCTYLVKNAL